MRTFKEFTEASAPDISPVDIKWDIWEEPSVRVSWLRDNYSYSKIEFTYKDTSAGVEICFLMGFTDDGEKPSWKVWSGKTGAVSYSDDWSWDTETADFKDAIVKASDIASKFITDVYNDPDNYVAYYIHI